MIPVSYDINPMCQSCRSQEVAHHDDTAEDVAVGGDSFQDSYSEKSGEMSMLEVWVL